MRSYLLHIIPALFSASCRLTKVLSQSLKFVADIQMNWLKPIERRLDPKQEFIQNFAPVLIDNVGKRHSEMIRYNEMIQWVPCGGKPLSPHTSSTS